ncbi:MAG TPA: hypothetical protein PL009_08450 [Flavipsychrobacter sp.]|nr:hypothetical protein [Flavipsychrobacter sp.]
MPAYLFQIELPAMTQEMANLIPEHRDLIDKLFIEARMLSYSVSSTRDQIWCVVDADDEKEAMEIVSGFPLRKFFVDVSCHQLLLHNNNPSPLPEISLN